MNATPRNVVMRSRPSRGGQKMITRRSPWKCHAGRVGYVPFGQSAPTSESGNGAAGARSAPYLAETARSNGNKALETASPAGIIGIIVTV
jgi:hypothetical protein